MKEFFVSVPKKSLASGYSVTRFFREEDMQECLSEPGAEQIDHETALKRAGGNPNEIISHYLGVHVPKIDQNALTISGAWYIESLPGFIVAELEDGTLISFPISPYREITSDDTTIYEGQHPRKLHGVPVPTSLYPYYNLDKSDESLSEVIRVRVSPSELERVRAAAGNKSLSEFVRAWIRTL
jgi:hypothetical protein